MLEKEFRYFAKENLGIVFDKRHFLMLGKNRDNVDKILAKLILFATL